MSKKLKKKTKVKSYILGADIKPCPRCENMMENQVRSLPSQAQHYYFTEWDYCRKCNYIQFYEKFKVFVNK